MVGPMLFVKAIRVLRRFRDVRKSDKLLQGWQFCQPYKIPPDKNVLNPTFAVKILTKYTG
jgi:hypothetical protein